MAEENKTNLTKSEEMRRKICLANKKKTADLKKLEEEKRILSKINRAKSINIDQVKEFDIILNGDSIIHIVFAETSSTLEKIFKDFKN